MIRKLLRTTMMQDIETYSSCNQLKLQINFEKFFQKNSFGVFLIRPYSKVEIHAIKSMS